MPSAPLQPEAVPVFFGKLDTKTAPRLAQQGTLVECVNAQMTQTGRIQKRPGYAPVGNANSSMALGQGLTVVNGELVAQASGQVWGYSTASGNYTSRGRWSTVQPKVENVISNYANQTDGDVAFGAGLAVYVWTDTRSNTSRYTVQDVATGQAIIADQDLGFSSERGKVVFINGLFVFFGQSGANLNWRTLKASAPTATPSVAVTAIAGLTAGPYDVIANPVASKIAIAAITGGTFVITTALLDPFTGVVGSSLLSGVATSGSAVISWMDDGDFSSWDGNYYLACMFGAVVTMSTFKSDLNLAGGGSVTVTAGATGTGLQLVGYVDHATTPVTKRMWIECVVASNRLNTFISLGTEQGGGVTFTPSFLRSVGLASRLFRRGSAAYLAVAYDGFQSTTIAAIQQTYFVVDAVTGEVLSKFLSTGGTGVRPTTGHVSSVVALDASRYIVAVSRKVQVSTENGTTVLLQSLTKVTLDFASTTLGGAREIGGGAYFAGGTIRRYDGSSTPELGFNVYPEMLTLADGGAGAMSAGTYAYVSVYAEFDGYGVLHRSAPSLPVSITIAASHAVNITATNYRLTSKGRVVIEIYRANPGDPNFYRITPTGSPLVSVTTSDTQVFVDTLLTTESVKREPLYTTGGVLQNDGPPPARLMVVHRDRLVLAGLDLPSQLLPSKPILPNGGLAFSSAFTVAMDPSDGDITAVASMDGSLIVFTAYSIYSIGGDGPNVLGVGSYAAPVRLPGNTGTTSPASVVVTDKGVMFASSDGGGIYLLSRGLELSYIGADVEAFNGTSISGAISLSRSNQTRFASSSATAPTLVHDDYHQRWYQWTNQAVAACCLFQGLFTFISPTGGVFQETPGVFSDNGEPIAERLTFAVMSPFAPGAWGRLWALQLVGDFAGPHILRVRFRYDHTPWFSEELRIDAGAASSSGVYGGQTYGVGNFGGVSPGDYRFEIRPSQQRFSAVQISIEDVLSGVVSGGMDLSAMVLLIGAQPGSLAKLPASRQMVTQ